MDETEEISLGVTFPLPFRVLVLCGLGILGWATNLHGLSWFGVDFVHAMDLRELHQKPPSLRRQNSFRNSPEIPNFYKSVYRLFAVYSVWCTAAWLVYRLATHGNSVLVDTFGFIPGLTALVCLLSLLCPFNIIERPQRAKFLRALQRCLFLSRDGPVYFADVVFADIFTSFAKVLGDVWLSARMLLPGNSLLLPPAEDSWLRWVMPTIMSLPYLIRLRQCLIEYGSPLNTSRRPLFNALKYATAFPVIYLSAAQRIVVLDLVKEKGDQIRKEAWHGEHQLFRLWLLAAAVNSLYSFWWDVSNDWGLDLLKSQSNEHANGRSPTQRRIALPHLHSGSPLLTSEFPGENSRSTSGESGRQTYPFGLRPTLLYPLPVYPLLIFLNLVLRLTWSIKLSSHLHSKTDGSVAIFWLEMAEVFRRWMWVFLRVEWEVIRKGRLTPDEEYGGDDDTDFEMIENDLPDA
ncbi:EXS family-domain-containing protein [Mycena floridula]|nr:EXS family-domain-containing protein [Mycena floridula]